MPLLELLRLQAESGLPPQTAGGDAPRLARLFELRPAAPAGEPAGLRSALRPYQAAGADWLRFLDLPPPADGGQAPGCLRAKWY